MHWSRVGGLERLAVQASAIRPRSTIYSVTVLMIDEHRKLCGLHELRIIILYHTLNIP